MTDARSGLRRKDGALWGGLLAWLVLLGAATLVPPASGGPATTDLAIEKTDAPDPVEKGERLTYRITVTNLTGAAATAVVVEDKLPANVDFGSVTPSQGTCARAGRNVDCELGNLTGDGTATIEIRVRPRKTGEITNTATVTASNDPTAATASETTQVIAGAPSCGGETATIVGTPGPDVITGTEERDVINAFGGRDVVVGLGGNDAICGKGGGDTLKGQAGEDLVKGGRGRDRARGGAGNDRVKGNRRDDRLRGGVGDDQLAGGGGVDWCRGGAGNDTLRSCER